MNTYKVQYKLIKWHTTDERSESVHFETCKKAVKVMENKPLILRKLLKWRVTND